MNNLLDRLRFQFLACLIFIVGLFGCESQIDQQALYPFKHSGLTMGTSFSIKVSDLPETVSRKQLLNEIDQRLAIINVQMSTYLESSELSSINRKPPMTWLKVSDALLSVLAEAKKISLLSGGAFDITVGPLVNLWGFGPDAMTDVPPDEALIKDLLNQIGDQFIQLDTANATIQKLNPALYLDLSALAKGYAVDEVANLFAENHINNYLVEIGGEIRLSGVNGNGENWRIAIEKPVDDLRSVQKVVAITDIAIATSGDYRNYFDVNGVRYSHTIDPRVGRPITHKLASVTVLRHTTMEADALATALMVLGPKEGFLLAEREGIAALFIIKAEQGFIEKQSSAYTELTR